MDGEQPRRKKSRFGAPVAQPLPVLPIAPPPMATQRQSRFGAAPPIAAAPVFHGAPAPSGGSAMDQMLAVAAAGTNCNAQQFQQQLLAPQERQPSSFTMSADGTMVDSRGRAVDMGGPVSTLNINLKNSMDRDTKAKLKRQKREQRKVERANPYLAHLDHGSSDDDDDDDNADEELVASAVDQTLHSRDRFSRARGGLKFIEKGTWMKRADGFRARDERVAQKEVRQHDPYRHLRRKTGTTDGAADGEEGEQDADDDGGGEYAQQPVDVSPSNQPDPLAGLDLTTNRGKALKAAYEAATQNGIPLSTTLRASGGETKIRVKPMPLVEWWDVRFLPRETRTTVGSVTKACADDVVKAQTDAAKLHSELEVENLITGTTPFCKLVEHPVPIEPLIPKEIVPALKMPLTKRERARIKKRAKEEKRQETQLKIQIGLIPAPKPKAKISNLNKVYGAEAVADPSRMEAMVEKDRQQRVQEHLMRGQAAKLTPAEKRAKRDRKAANDATGAIHCAVFRVGDLTNPPDLASKRRFKIDVKAHTFRLTGCVLIVEEPVSGNNNGKPASGCNLVMVEGGKKAVRKFVALMLRKIDWKQQTVDDGEMMSDSESDSDEDEEMNKEEEKKKKNKIVNSCELVSYSQTPARLFNEFEYKEVKSAQEARTFLDGFALAYHWDSCARFDPVTHDRTMEKLLLP